MSDAPNFAHLVPGFEFLQGLVKNAGAALPAMGQWVAPTLDPEELRKRIEELKTVQFWLEQNARMLAATIQALEVQRMTLSTLQTMNVQMADLRGAMKIPTAAPSAGARAAAPAADAPAGTPPEAAASAPAPSSAARPSRARAKDADAPALPGVVDPMQWWGALTKQFTQLAAGAMHEGAADAAGKRMKQGLDVLGETFRQAAAVPAGVAQHVAAAAAPRAPAKAAKKIARPRGAAPAAKTRAR
jgi:hypothetical protein